MKVNLGGVVPLSTVDWPGRASMVVFLRGCPMRCPHCHNQALQSGDSSVKLHAILKNMVKIKTFGCEDCTGQIELEVASKRVSSTPVVDALVFSGGEPLVQIDEVIALAKAAKGLRLKVGLETCGYYPDRLFRLLNYSLEYRRKDSPIISKSICKKDVLIDTVFLDIKAVLDDPKSAKYAKATGITDAAPRVLESLRILMRQEVPLEVRIAIFPDVQYQRDLMQIARHIAKLMKEFPKNKLESMILYQGRPLNREFEPINPERIHPLSNAVNALINDVNKQVKIKVEKEVRSNPMRSE